MEHDEPCSHADACSQLVTYNTSAKGIRRRVVNGKRTDLCTLLLREFNALLKPENLSAPQLFQGHTRFATSSIAALPGCRSYPQRSNHPRYRGLLSQWLHILF